MRLVAEPKIGSLAPSLLFPDFVCLGEIYHVVFILMKKNHLGGITVLQMR